MKRTYALYLSRFRTIFVIALVPCLFAYLCQFLQRALVDFIRSNDWLPPWGSTSRWWVLIAVALFEGAVYWVISGFFLAAVASNVLGKPGPEKPLATDALRAAGKRLVPVAAATLVIWAGFAVGRYVILLPLYPVFYRLGLSANRTAITITFALALLLLGGLASRLGLAIPILMDNHGVSIRQSLGQSRVKTKGWAPFFTLFLAKSAAIGYGAYWLVNLGLDRLAQRNMPREEVRFWLASALYISLAAMVESPLFIAFSLLYRDSKLKPEEAFPAVVG
jgi:hypothetical protein